MSADHLTAAEQRFIPGMGAFESKLRFVRIVCLVACTLLHPVSLQASAGPQQQVDVLIPSVPMAIRQLSPGETHTYRAELDAGVWRLSVTQNGVDTVASFVLPDGTRLGPFNSPGGRRGTESFLVTLKASGTVEVSLHPRERAAVGHYTTALERLASPVIETRAVTEERGVTEEQVQSQQEQILAESAATAAARSFAEGSKEAAREHYRRALSLWPSSDPAGKARTLVALARLARSADEPSEAAALFRRALTVWRALDDRENEATTLNRLGLILNRLGESADARPLFEQALALWQALEEPESEIVAHVNLCLVFQRQGDFLDARDCYQAGLAIIRALQQPGREMTVLSNLAGVHWRLGELDRALAIYDEVLSRSEAGSAEALQGRVLTNRSHIFYELGEAEQALLGYNRALAIFRRLESRRMEGAVLSHLGTTYLNLGELDRARTYLEQALPIRQAVGDPRGAATTWRAIARTYGRQGDWPQAFDAYGKAFALSRALADRRGEATLLLSLGKAHAEAGSLQLAIAELEQVVDLHRQLGDQRQEAQSLLALGKVHHQRGVPERALEILGRAGAMFRGLRDRAGEVRTLEATARVERDRGQTGTALIAATAAVELLEDLRTTAGGLRQRAAFLATRRGVYELQIDLLMRRHRADPRAGHDRQAFAMSERARSRATLDLIRADVLLDDGLRQRVRAATRQLAASSAQQMALLGREHEPDEATAANRKVVAALAELEEVRAEARRQNPRYNQLVRGETSNAAEVADLLDPGTLLLEYVLGEPRSFLWAVSTDAFASFELPGREVIEALARQAHADLSTIDLRTGRTSRKALEELGGLLLTPVAERLATAQRLVVVADGALHYLPFAAFPRPGSHEPLVVRHEVVHLPSASTLAWQRRRDVSSVPTKTIAVLADPVFDALDSRLSAAREAPGLDPPTLEPPVLDPPVLENVASANLMTRLRGDFGTLSRLPATGKEAAAIISLVNEPAQRLLALGLEAHRERVVGGELASYRYIHFATHGLINTRHPELSGLVLATYDFHGRTRNGFLSMEDVSGLELSAEMVVLSGCQTALGREIRGEGLLGLTHGFMAAGVPRVVASMWPVQDEATARLMAHFYRGVLVEDKPPAAALAAAQRSIRQQRSWSDPYFWSAFVLLGDWR